MIAQQILNAISLGGIYALLALGLAVVYSITGLINFAHGEFMTLAGYGIFAGIASGAGLTAAIFAGLLVAGVAAVVTERAAFSPMRKADINGLMLTSFAVGIVIKIMLQNGVSARPLPIAMPAGLSGVLDIGFATVGVIPLLSIAIALVVVVLLNLFLKHTIMGLAMRASADDFPILRLMGVRASAVIMLAFAISGLLAGIAAVLWVAQRGSVDPLMGSVPVLKAFVATVIGGLGSLTGAVLGGFVLGVLEVGFQTLLPAEVQPFRDAFVLTVIILILLTRPEGLLPARRGRRS